MIMAWSKRLDGWNCFASDLTPPFTQLNDCSSFMQSWVEKKDPISCTGNEGLDRQSGLIREGLNARV